MKFKTRQDVEEPIMKKFIKYLGMSLLIGFAWSPIPAAEEPVELKDIRFRTLSWSGDVQGVSVWNGNPEAAAWIPIKAMDYIRSPFVEVKTGPELTFFRWEEQEDGTRVPVEDGRVRIDGMGDTLLILITERKNKRSYFAMPESLQDFPVDTYRFLNASKLGLVVGTGKERAPLAPRKLITMKPELDEQSVGVKVQLAGLVDGEPRLIYSNRLARRKGQRTLFFIVDSDKGRVPVEVKRLVEGTINLGSVEANP